MKLSILILSIPSRIHYLEPLYTHLNKQIDGCNLQKDVEVLTLMDNKVLSIGDKRNKLLEICSGEYLAFLDDDDWISDDYINSLNRVINDNSFLSKPIDLLCFRQHCTVNGKEFEVDFDLRNPHEPMSYDANGKCINIKRPPYHMCAWRSEIAKSEKFKPCSYGEDIDWCIRLYPKIKSQYKIDKILHYYRYEDKKSESIQYSGRNGI